jgi:hypothetical protein
MSEFYQSLSHSKWDCRYHVVFIPKYRRKVLYGEIRRQPGQIFRELARQKECQIVEGHFPQPGRCGWERTLLKTDCPGTRRSVIIRTLTWATAFEANEVKLSHLRRRELIRGY